jgi:dTDP-glucose 4,6-dehydratase
VVNILVQENASMHLLVTGGAGFIGSNFIRLVLHTRPGWRVTNLDVLSYSGNLENLSDVERDPRYTFVKGDVCDMPTVLPLVERADAVVHMAAESHVDRSIMDARPFVTSNVLGAQTMLDACRRAAGGGGRWPGRMLYVSTDEVYGSLPLDRPDLRFSEDSPLAPNSPYAASKAGADLLVRAYFRTFGMNVVTTRCSNNFGPYQFPEKVIPLFVTNLLEGVPVPLYGDGLNVRDWLHVDDHGEALLAVIERGRAGEVYNIGGENERSNLELTRTILEIMGQGQDMIRLVPDRPAHDRRYAVSTRKIAAELGWRPTRSAWPQALAQTIDWYTTHRQWWERVKSGAYREYYRRQYGEA